MQPGKLIGVGIGPGDPELLTLKGARILKDCDVVFTVISRNVSESVSENVVRSVRPEGRIIQLSFSMSRDPAVREAVTAANAEQVISELRKGHTCAYATLGDTLTYSTYGYITAIVRKVLPEAVIETVPGITSYSTLAAEAGSILVENTETLRVIPAFKASMADSIEFPKGTSTILLKTYHSRHALIERLRKEPDLSVLYGENLTMEDAYLSRDLDEIDARPDAYFSLMLVRNKA